MAYEGWKNRQTWNVALWINNDYPLYKSAVKFMENNSSHKNPYKAFVLSEGLSAERTPDRIGYISTRLDYDELNKMMHELTE
jgi:hypothetical protein